MELWQYLGILHPKLVQFPLVLLLAGLAFDAVGLIRRSERFHWAAKILTCAGTAALLIAFICGIYAEIWAGRAGVPQDAIEWHEFLANVASWGFVVLAAWRLFLDGRRRKTLALYTAIGLSYYGLLVLTAYLGGSLVFDYGAAVTGAQANTVISLHDLNTLATRQTNENLKYSEMMHHIFGWLVLALSGSLFAHALFPRHGHRLRWVGPTLLLAGGIFLFFFADLDLYRLTDLRQLRDREVQLHKTIAIVLAVVGVAGLRRGTKERPYSGGRGSRRAGEPDPEKDGSAGASPSPVAGRQSKLVAVLALIGGGLLFTHVHTVAPYANVAAGVYIAHMVLGLVALTIGATRLLQDTLPRYRQAFAIAFAGFMCVESVLLITYNEGLPWYIGYGRYNRWGPHAGTIAPYGPVRAELTFDNATQAMNVYVLDRFRDEPVKVAARELNVLVARGYQETAIPVHAAEEGPACDHFVGRAAFLRAVPAFSARLALPVHGHQTMGYFDPWVTPVVHFVPPNEVARYQCPMHEGFLSQRPGVCDLCGMPLVPIRRGPQLTLHDPPYEMLLATDRAGPSDQLELTFTPQRDGQVLRDLAIVHEHPLHLIIVSEDLTFFDHVHPIVRDDGSLRIEYGFPRPGRYLLFADITPRGDRSQVFRLPLTIGNAPPETPARLAPSAAPAEIVGDDTTVTAELVPQPRTITAATHVHLLFRLSDGGRPITDLEPYLAAMGHCVAVSEDGQTYLHCHPEQVFTPTKDERGGPVVAFHAAFPRPGRYKLWGQFQRGGKVLTVPFVVDVRKPVLPPALVNFILDE